MTRGLISGRTAGIARAAALPIFLALALSPACGGSPDSSAGSASVIPATPPAQGRSLTEQIPALDEGQTITAQAEDVALSPQARLLAERFMCVCGCGDILSTCSCLQTPGSRDMKQLLQRLVDEGKSPSEIRTEMVAVYGQAALP